MEKPEGVSFGGVYFSPATLEALNLAIAAQVAAFARLERDGTFRRIFQAVQDLTAAHHRTLAQVSLSPMIAHWRPPFHPIVAPLPQLSPMPLTDSSHHLSRRCDDLEQEVSKLQQENELMRISSPPGPFGHAGPASSGSLTDFVSRAEFIQLQQEVQILRHQVHLLGQSNLFLLKSLPPQWAGNPGDDKRPSQN
jgi:hypothetical protein